MAALPPLQNSSLRDLVFAAWQARGDKERLEPRTYLGVSWIGDPCARKMWLQFRWSAAERFDGRMLRLMQTGHIQELRVKTDLEMAGLEVHLTDESGEQFGFTDECGHIAGHIDGVVLGVPEALKTWHLLEIKTHNHASFTKLTAEGVKKSKPVHYAQMQVYMRMMKLDRALYYAVNKNTDDIWTERIELDKAFSDGLLERGRKIVMQDFPPERISNSSADPECKYCPMKTICWGDDFPAVNCRTCEFSEPVGGGDWACRWHDFPVLTKQDQMAACSQHVFARGTVNALPLAHGEDEQGQGWVQYERNGKQFVNTGIPGGLTSHELVKLTIRGACLDAVQRIKSRLPRSEVVETEIADGCSASDGAG